MGRDFIKEINDINSNIKVLEPIKRGSDKVLCKCLVDGYEWRTRPYDLLRGFGCHMCKGVPRYTTETFKRRLKVINPTAKIIGEYKGSHKKIEWICTVCEKTNSSKSYSLLQGRSCRECSYKESSKKQRYDTEWFKNIIKKIVGNEYIVLGEYKTTDDKVDLMHTSCKHSFSMSPHNFISNGNRCPKCNGGVRLKSSEYFRNEIEVLTGNEYTFVGDYIGNNKPSKFKHLLCEGYFITTPDSFLSQGTRCPDCHFISKGELEIKRILEELGIPFIQQKTFNDLVHLKKLRFDFFLPDLNTCIEYDGRQHFESIHHWGGSEALKETQFRDKLKNDYCVAKGINLIRIDYREREIKKVLLEGFKCMKISLMN